jgi:hypothetical protein
MLEIATVKITIVQTRPHSPSTFRSHSILAALVYYAGWSKAIVSLLVGLGRFVRKLISGLS